MSEKDKLLKRVPKPLSKAAIVFDAAAGQQTATSAREAWRVFGIMAEFVEATERLSAVRPAVSIFGLSLIHI